MTRELYDRSTTGEVHRVEVVVLGRAEGRGRTLVCTPAQGEGIVRLWRALPEAEQARCHIPAYGLRFYSGRTLSKRTLLLEASLCWECNNVYLTEAGKDYYSTFDRDHPDSQRLLDILKEIADAQWLLDVLGEIAGPAGAGQELEG